MSRRAFPSESCVVADVMPPPNFGERKDGRRPDMIVLHYTGMVDAAAALEHLRTPASQVSCHYLVFEDGRVIQLVQESKRAWHAGVASWAGETDINSCSIGIEIVNPGHEFGYRDFPKRQIAAVTALCRGILTRNTSVPGPRRASRARAKSFPGPSCTIQGSAIGSSRPRSLTAHCRRWGIAAMLSRRCSTRSANTVMGLRKTVLTIPPPTKW